MHLFTLLCESLSGAQEFYHHALAPAGALTGGIAGSSAPFRKASDWDAMAVSALSVVPSQAEIIRNHSSIFFALKSKCGPKYPQHFPTTCFTWCEYTSPAKFRSRILSWAPFPGLLVIQPSSLATSESVRLISDASRMTMIWFEAYEKLKRSN